MRLANAVTVLFWLASFALVAGTLRRALVWRRGRPARVDPWGIASVPRRYFVDLHRVVAREPAIARAHVAAAGGAVAAIVLTAVNYGLALYRPWLDTAIVAAALMMLAGATLMALRRRHPPARLSRGAWDRLPVTLGLFAIGLGAIALLPSGETAGIVMLAALAGLAIGSAELALGIGLGGPMKHAVAGLLHLAFHPRLSRFSGARPTALAPLDLVKRDFGVRAPQDFAWNQLLGFDACVQCGKCESRCPAFAAGQPLNPKKLIQDLVAGMEGASDAAYSGSPHPGQQSVARRGSPEASVVPGLVSAETLWACTTCRACVEECPMMIEHVDAVIGLRRHRNLVLGEAPGKAAEVLANLRETGSQGGHRPEARHLWSSDLGVPTAEAGRPVDVLLVVGEGAYDGRYQRTLRALVRVLKAAGVELALWGPNERDTGDLARRLGDEATFEILARRNIEALAGLTFRRIVTADPHLLHSLRNEYRPLGGHYEVLHHTSLLAELAEQGRLAVGRSQETRPVAYHDPCYLARYNGETAAPRELLSRLGLDVREMKRAGLDARCCGGGGGAALTDIPGRRRIPDMRMGDAREVGAEVVAVACPQCTAMLEGVAGDRAEVMDIAELVAAAIEGAGP